ncbi:MAG: hypothetical protein WCS55_12705 [Sulfuricurvum sp.]|jgi:hypothetical protein|uniref:hypothetical protein n=1 Tax=Sulfuricurvum sp. TaxID=2025608 RepID=UPI0035684E03
MNTLLKTTPLNPFENERVTWLHFHFDYDKQNDVSFFLELGLPTPSVIWYGNRGFRYAWAIDGYFGKKSGKQYFKDIRDRISALFAFHEIEYQDIGFTKPIINESAHICEMIYRLNDFQIDDYRQSKARKQWKQETDVLLYRELGKSLIDALFESTRKEIYALKRENRLTYENVLMVIETANAVVFDYKYTFSDVKAKAKNMYQWTLENYTGSSLDRKEYQRLYMRQKRRIERNGIERTRQQGAEIARNCNSDMTRSKVISAVTLLRNNGKLFKKSGDMNISLVAKIAGVNRRSAKKYIENK